MLRLNSQYAKSYIKEQPSYPLSYQCSQKTGYLNANRNMPNFEANNHSNKKISGSGRSQSGSLAIRKDNSVKQRVRVYEDKEENLYDGQQYGKSRNRQTQEGSSLNNLTKSPRLLREPNSQINQNYRGLENLGENQEFIKRGKYQRYERLTNPSIREPYGEKNQFFAKHNKRNEQIRNKITRESYNRSYNHYNQRDNAKNQGLQTKISNSKEINKNIYNNKLINSYENDDIYQERSEKYARKLVFDDQCQNEELIQRGNAKDNNGKYRQRLQREQGYEKENSNLMIDRFQGRQIEYNQRKNSSYKQIQQTPSRFNKSCSFQPGSAEKKKSLIEKSQMLQQKLKKLTSTQISSNQQQKTSQFETESVSNKVSPNYRQQNYASNLQKNPQLRKYNNLSQNEQGIKQNLAIKMSEQYRPPSRHNDLLRTPSPILQSRSSENQGQAIERIMQLNEKINERIQSIISNYTKK